MTIPLDQIPTLSEGDVEVMSVRFTDLLDSGELLTGTPTITEVTTSDLTIGNKAVSTAALTILGKTAAIGEAVQCSVSGQLASQGLYTIAITVSTDATVARTLKRDARFYVK